MSKALDTTPHRGLPPEWGPKEKKDDVHNNTVDKKTVNTSSQDTKSIQETAEASQTCLLASARTEETDVRASKLQCDPQTTADGWFL